MSKLPHLHLVQLLELLVEVTPDPAELLQLVLPADMQKAWFGQSHAWGSTKHVWDTSINSAYSQRTKQGFLQRHVGQQSIHIKTPVRKGPKRKVAVQEPLLRLELLDRVRLDRQLVRVPGVGHSTRSQQKVNARSRHSQPGTVTARSRHGQSTVKARSQHPPGPGSGGWSAAAPPAAAEAAPSPPARVSE